MPKRNPVMQTIEVSQGSDQLSQLVTRVRQEQIRVVLEQGGVPVAAIVSADDLQELLRWKRQREEAFGIIDEIRAAFADVSDVELEREIDDAISEVRAEKQAQQRAARTER